MSENRTDAGRRLLIQAALAVSVIYFYIFMEWLFFFTKPSFMSRLCIAESLQVFLVTPAPFVIAGIALLFLLWMPGLAARSRAAQRMSAVAGMIVPVVVLSAALLLLVDNFTYTVLRFGVRTTEGAEKLAYVFLLLVLVAVSIQVLSEIGAKLLRSARSRTVIIAASSAVLASLLVMLFSIDYAGIGALDGGAEIVEPARRPNFVVLSVDGLNADHLSVYGYDRATTPYLDGVSESALICENNFVNADVSSGSIVSLFTGKLPTQTRVVRSPDILRGKDSYQHLPGILKRHGYHTIDISMRHHADPVDLNVRNGFDWVNFRKIREDRLADLATLLLGGKSYYFIIKMHERIVDRLAHMFGIAGMEDPLAEVILSRKKYSKDGERVRTLLSRVRVSSTPFFAHVHLVGTHGPTFHPDRRLFSAGKDQPDSWMRDFYDDAILNFDSQLREIMEALRNKRLSYNTVVVICTDHGQGWSSNVRTPLILLFPYGGHSGRITANAQNLDIAATILDYMGIERPEWMGGRSLLAPRIDPDRFIFSAGRKHYTVARTQRGWNIDEHKIKPPFYSLGCVTVFHHQKGYELDLEKMILTVYDIEGHTAPRPEADLPDPQDVARMIIDHLAGNGYDVSSLKMPVTVVEPEHAGVRDTSDHESE